MSKPLSSKSLTNPDSHQKWNAKNYNQNSSIQLEASHEIFKKISFKGNEKVLDIGSGDGKITALISSFLPDGEVIGIDLSPEMIQFAKENFHRPEYTNISFRLQNAESIAFQNEFDSIFSSFALHWILDFDAFLSRANQALKNSGSIAFTIPLGISSPLEQATKELIESTDWSNFFTDELPPWRFSTSSDYKKMIMDAGFKPKICEEVSHTKIFQSREEFENYVIQWYPYTNYVDQEMREAFFRILIDRYLEIEPCSALGRVYFEFSRIDIIAVKP